MTNHIHIIAGRKGEAKIEDIIRDFKKYTSVHICRAIEENRRESRRKWLLWMFRQTAVRSKKHQKYCFWQNEYHPIELSGNQMMERVLTYIHANPVVAGIIEAPEDYLYSSARDYAGRKGLIEVEFIA